MIFRLEPERVKKPWGAEMRAVTTARYSGKIIAVHAWHSLSVQYHVEKDETLLMLTGFAIVQEFASQVPAGEPVREEIVVPGDCVRIQDGTVHRLVAVFNCMLAEFSTPHDDADTHRLAYRGRSLGGPVDEDEKAEILARIRPVLEARGRAPMVAEEILQW